MKRFLSVLLICTLIILQGIIAAEGKGENLTYEISLEQKEGVDNNLYWTKHEEYSLENLNDGDPDTIVQAEYHSGSNKEMYKEGHLLNDPFYMVLDLTKLYDLESIEINWYPKGNRCYKYIIYTSEDDSNYTLAADHSGNVTEKDPIKDTFKKVSARYIKIEILGNYRPSDDSHSEFFPTSEITVIGTLAQNQPDPTPTIEPGSVIEKLEYTPELLDRNGLGGLYWTADYPEENINDGDTSSLVQIEYIGWYDESTGLLDDPFDLVLDLGAVYDLSEIRIFWFLKNDKYYMYKISTSLYGDEYTVQVDRTENKDIGRIDDTLEGISARYVCIEFYGNYNPSENGANKFYAIRELNVYGKLSANQPTEAPQETPKIAETNTPLVTENPTPTNEPLVKKGKPIGLAIIVSLLVLAAIATVIIVIRIKKGKSERNA